MKFLKEKVIVSEMKIFFLHRINSRLECDEKPGKLLTIAMKTSKTQAEREKRLKHFLNRALVK